MGPRTLLHLLPLSLVTIVIWGAGACADDQPTAPDTSQVQAAKGGNGGGGGGKPAGADPTVTATDPGSAPQDTTLDVRVFGSNYDAGSKVALLLNGKATTKVKTNSTFFVSSTELVANITITLDAEPDLYDVQVTASNGKKGVGIEMFEVTGTLSDFADRPAEPAPAGLYEDGMGPYITGSPAGNSGESSSPDPGNFNVRVPDDSGRFLDLVLPQDWTLTGPITGGSVFHVPGLAYANCPDGCPIGGPPEGYNYSPSVFFYFHVDSPGRKDDSYNVVWTDAWIWTLRTGSDGRPCAWRVIGGTGDLWLRPDILIETGGSVALEVTIEAFDGACAIGNVLQ